jgi:hypothetical protein
VSGPQVLGYVLVSTGPDRDPVLPHTSVMKDRAGAEHEQREWAKTGRRYVLCELRVVEK